MRTRHIFSAVAAGWAAWAVASAPIAASPGETTTSVSSAADLRDNISKYCVTCHNGRMKTAGLTLDALDPAHLGADAAIWEKVARKLRSGAMPPPGVRRPDQATADSMVKWLESSLDAAAAEHPHPGRTDTLRRLNRTEYQNTIRD